MKVDFIIVGAAKCGTTSLFEYLAKHPQICMSHTKETNFYALGDEYVQQNWDNYAFPVQSQAQYEAQFSHCKDGQIKGEASPIYLESKVSAARIKSEQADAKIIIMLRNPVERTFSGYLMHVRYGDKAIDFKSLAKSDFSDDKRYVFTSFYYEKVKKYMQLFGRDKVKIIIFEDFVKDTNKHLQDLCSFLNVSAYNFDTDIIHNKGVYPKNLLLNKLLMSHIVRHRLATMMPRAIIDLGKSLLKKNQSANAPELPDSLRLTLKKRFEQDVSKLEGLLDMSLQIWKN